MKGKVKLLSLTLTMVFMMSVFSGCGKEKDTSKDTTSSTSKKFKIVLVAKTEGIPWFDDMRLGVNQFAKKYRDVVEAKQIAPEGGDPAKQVQMVEDLIAQGVDAIVVVPNDPQSMKPVLQKAKEKGIIVISHEATNLTDVVDYDVEAFKNKDFGILMFKKLAEAMGGQGQFAAMVGGLTMQTHMEWYDAGMDYIKTNYPKMVAVSSQPYEDKNDDTTAKDKALEILKAYPNIKGFVGTSVSAGSNFSAVLEEKNNKNVKVVSLGIPSVSCGYLKDGFMTKAQCWKPADAGYTTCLVALKLLQSKKIENGIDLERTGYEKISIDGKIIYGNAPMELDGNSFPNGKYPF